MTDLTGRFQQRLNRAGVALTHRACAIHALTEADAIGDYSKEDIQKHGIVSVLERMINLSTSAGVVTEQYGPSEISLRVAWAIESSTGLLSELMGTCMGHADGLGLLEEASAIGRVRALIDVSRGIVDERFDTANPLRLLTNDLKSADDDRAPVGDNLGNCADVDWRLLSLALALSLDVARFFEQGIDNRDIQVSAMKILQKYRDEEWFREDSCPSSLGFTGGIVGMAQSPNVFIDDDFGTHEVV